MNIKPSKFDEKKEKIRAAQDRLFLSMKKTQEAQKKESVRLARIERNIIKLENCERKIKQQQRRKQTSLKFSIGNKIFGEMLKKPKFASDILEAIKDEEKKNCVSEQLKIAATENNLLRLVLVHYKKRFRSFVILGGIILSEYRKKKNGAENVLDIIASHMSGNAKSFVNAVLKKKQYQGIALLPDEDEE